ncbi:glycosyltransferase family 2 protein [Rubritalea marina]|uniref:glycosyltransferase family 2 protein n=1 Tax=Rubritalea marina TaxID=361055 RepID=UPI00035D2881|nr:glycosyltransferase family 2 protein [Rubritalea marina]
MKALPTRPNRKLVSFIVPAMNEPNALETLYKQVRQVMRATSYNWEIIFIDEGSTDRTWEFMVDLAFRDSGHVSSYKLPGNHGKADALALGYKVAGGDIIFTMDADLQDDPKEIPSFLNAIEQGSDIVNGRETERSEAIHRAALKQICNTMLNLMTGAKLSDHTCSYKACTREVIKSLPQDGDVQAMVTTIATIQGFKATEIEIKHHARKYDVNSKRAERLVIGAFQTFTTAIRQAFHADEQFERSFLVEASVNGNPSDPFIRIHHHAGVGAGKLGAA